MIAGVQEEIFHRIDEIRNIVDLSVHKDCSYSVYLEMRELVDELEMLLETSIRLESLAIEPAIYENLGDVVNEKS